MVIQLVIIFVITAVMWIGAFINPVTMPEPGEFAPLYGLLYTWLSGRPILATSIGIVLLLSEAMLLNEMLYERKMVSQNTLMPAMLYIVLASGVCGAQTITPMLIVNMMIILALRNIMKTSSVSMTLNMTFGTATYIAISTMFYTPSAVLIIPMLLMFPVYQLYGWRDWVVMVLGLIAPYIPLVGVYLMQDRCWFWCEGFKNDIINVGLNFDGGILAIVIGIILALYMIVMVFGGLNLANDHPTAFQHSAIATALPLIGGLLMIPYESITPLNTQLFAVGIAFLATLLYESAHKKLWIYEVSIWGLLVVTLINIYV